MIDIIINDMFGRSNTLQKYLTRVTKYDRILEAIVKDKKDFSKIKLPSEDEEVLLNISCNMNIYTNRLSDILATVNRKKINKIYVIIAPYFVTNYMCITKIENSTGYVSGEKAQIGWLDLVAVRNFIGSYKAILTLTQLQNISKIVENLQTDLMFCDSYFIKKSCGIVDSMPGNIRKIEVYPIYSNMHPWTEEENDMQFQMYCNYIKKSTKRRILFEHEGDFVMI